MNADASILSLLSPLICLAVVAGLWWGAGSLMARLGWKRLAAQFATTAAPPANAQKFPVRCVTLFSNGALVRYRGWVGVWVSDAGVDLHPTFHIKPQHAPLHIAWAAVDAVRHDTQIHVTPYVLSLKGDYPDIQFDDASGVAVLAAWNRTPFARATEGRDPR